MTVNIGFMIWCVFVIAYFFDVFSALFPITLRCILIKHAVLNVQGNPARIYHVTNLIILGLCLCNKMFRFGIYTKPLIVIDLVLYVGHACLAYSMSFRTVCINCGNCILKLLLCLLTPLCRWC